MRVPPPSVPPSQPFGKRIWVLISLAFLTQCTLIGGVLWVGAHSAMQTDLSRGIFDVLLTDKRIRSDVFDDDIMKVAFPDNQLGAGRMLSEDVQLVAGSKVQICDDDGNTCAAIETGENEGNWLATGSAY